MSDVDGLHWFIDAWAVLDGYAFASFRRADSLEADVALFVAPPYFEPEPVASLATALGATRGHFQERFRDEAGDEVAFATLDEVIETIRRAYRAGGLDSDGTSLSPVRVPPVEPPSTGSAVPLADLVSPEMHDIWMRLHAALLGTPTAPGREKETRSLLTILLQASLPALVPRFIGHATLTLLSLIVAAGPERSARVREVCAWIHWARGLGVQVDVDTEHERLTLFIMGGGERLDWAAPWLRQLPNELGRYLNPIAYRTSGALIEDLHIPFTVPIVPAFQAAGGKIRYPRIPTLGHLMAAATADRLYMLALGAMHQFVPLLVLSLVQLPPAVLPYPGLLLLPETLETRKVCERAAAWLVRALLSGIPRDHPAEDAIHQLVSSLLTRLNDRDEGTPTPITAQEPAPRGPGPVTRFGNSYDSIPLASQRERRFMPIDLPRLVPDPVQRVPVQDTEFSLDVLGRYVCNTWEEATNNGGIGFDAVVIGAGMYGAYCAEKIYRLGPNLRVLVLDAGSLLVTEHVQNLSRIGLNAAGPKKDPTGTFPVPVITNADDPGTRERVWGIPMRSTVPFAGLAYCPGGRSLYWGGWAPRLTNVDLAQWPTAIEGYLDDGKGNAYAVTEREIGVDPSTDYISKDLYKELHRKLDGIIKAGVPNVDEVNQFAKGAPLAVQAAPPASGLFSFDKWSSMPILTEAIREAAEKPDWQRRLFLVPRAHVTKLHLANGSVATIEVRVNGQQKFLSVSPKCAVVLASSTIESTRLSLESFPTPLMGHNLMAHLRTNTVVRIHRSAFHPALPKRLEAAALFVRGSNAKGRFHLQITAAAVAGGSEDTMFRMVPDIDLLDRMLASQEDDWIVITLRGIGEMQGNRNVAAPKVTGQSPSWMDLSDQTDQYGMRRAWVNLVTTNDDGVLWNDMDRAALDLANALANNDLNKIKIVEQKRDGLGTTHHEAGTLWMGSNANDSVTNLDGRFHHVTNAYVAGPALFPTLGSANPSLTALALARRTEEVIVRNALGAEAGFMPLGSGGISGWRMAGSGGFLELGGNIIESVGGTGLLWFTAQQFGNFILRVDWRASSPDDNSGIFIRFPDPGNDWTIPVTQGYEIQIDNTGKNPDTNPPSFGDPLHNSGAIYKLAGSTAAPSVGQWHTYEIEASGATITVRLDGQQVSQLQNANRSPKGFIGLQNHHDGSRVQFSRLRIKELP